MQWIGSLPVLQPQHTDNPCGGIPIKDMEVLNHNFEVHL